MSGFYRILVFRDILWKEKEKEYILIDLGNVIDVFDVEELY